MVSICPSVKEMVYFKLLAFYLLILHSHYCTRFNTSHTISRSSLALCVSFSASFECLKFS